MRRILAFVLVLAMLMVSVPMVSEEVEAGGAEYFTATVYGGNEDGSIKHLTDADPVVDTTSTSGHILLDIVSSTLEYRSYLSFDMSSLTAGAIVTGIELTFYLRSNGAEDVYIYSGSFGAVLEDTDWGCGVIDGTLEGYVTTSYTVPNYVSRTATISPNSIISSMLQLELVVLEDSLDHIISFSESSGTYRDPYVTVTYLMPCSAVYDYTGGSSDTFEAFPIYSTYNNTHDLALLELETWTGVANISIHKLPGWTHLSHIPIANSTTETTDYYNLTGVIAGCTYRVYFAAPVVKQTTVYLASYHSDTGEGFPFETFRFLLNDGLTYNNTTASQIGASVFTVDYGQNYTITVLDYFGNVISSTPFVSNSLTKHVAVAIDVNSFKVFNQKEDFTRCRIYYQGAGTPIEYYAAPWEPVERFLRDGNYTVTVTWYDNQTAGDSVYFNITVNSSEFLMLEGLTISRVISDIAGVHAVQEVITYMLTPDVVFIGEDLPIVPNDAFDSGIELVHPWSVVHGWANGTEFTNETLFYYSYYTARKYYEVTLNVTNNDGVNWTNVTWFIGFPENRTIDYSTVRVYDLNNAVYLQAGLHYDMTLTGIRMKWTYFNDTLSRSFRISMYDANASSGGGMAIAVASEYSPSTYDGEPYYKSSVSWTNSFTYEYKGQYQVQFTFDDADLIKSSSVIVYDKNEQRVLGEGEYTFAGGVLTVGNVNAVIGEVYGFDIYFKLDTSAADSWSIYQTFGGVPIWGWLVIGTVVGILAMVIVDGKRTKGGRKLKLNGTAVAFALVMVSMLFILWYFHQAGVL